MYRKSQYAIYREAKLFIIKIMSNIAYRNMEYLA
ncbi:hypothetical protein AP058_01600 [Flavobacterium sp. TAB 87]|nr:hypothetical protein AP058_01600 [Flavobacterium sp. TAB 87]